jgi:hypothetical protein
MTQKHTHTCNNPLYKPLLPRRAPTNSLAAASLKHTHHGSNTLPGTGGSSVEKPAKIQISRQLANSLVIAPPSALEANVFKFPAGQYLVRYLKVKGHGVWVLFL